MTTPRLRASLVCQAENKLLLVRLRDPESGVEAWYPPGGGLEPGETPAAAAARETLEETGVVAGVIAGVELVKTYPFRWGGVSYQVTTHYLAARLERASPLPSVDDAAYNLGAAWVPIDEALEAMSVHPEIASAVAQALRLSDHASWRAHPSFAGPASTLLAIHGQFRAASEQLGLLAARGDAPELPWLARVFAPLAQTLHHHHRAEELMLFPLVQRRTQVAPARLASDHAALTAAIDDVEQSLRAGGSAARAREVIVTFEQILVSHLDREERLVVPVLLAMQPAEAWAELERPGTA